MDKTTWLSMLLLIMNQDERRLQGRFLSLKYIVYTI